MGLFGNLVMRHRAGGHSQLKMPDEHEHKVSAGNNCSRESDVTSKFSTDIAKFSQSADERNNKEKEIKNDHHPHDHLNRFDEEYMNMVSEKRISVSHIKSGDQLNAARGKVGNHGGRYKVKRDDSFRSVERSSTSEPRNDGSFKGNEEANIHSETSAYSVPHIKSGDQLNTARGKVGNHEGRHKVKRDDSFRSVERSSASEPRNDGSFKGNEEVNSHYSETSAYKNTNVEWNNNSMSLRHRSSSVDYGGHSNPSKWTNYRRSSRDRQFRDSTSHITFHRFSGEQHEYRSSKGDSKRHSHGAPTSRDEPNRSFTRRSTASNVLSSRYGYNSNCQPSAGSIGSFGRASMALTGVSRRHSFGVKANTEQHFQKSQNFNPPVSERVRRSSTGSVVQRSRRISAKGRKRSNQKQCVSNVKNEVFEQKSKQEPCHYQPLVYERAIDSELVSVNCIKDYHDNVRRVETVESLRQCKTIVEEKDETIQPERKMEPKFLAVPGSNHQNMTMIYSSKAINKVNDDEIGLPVTLQKYYDSGNGPFYYARDEYTGQKLKEFSSLAKALKYCAVEGLSVIEEEKVWL